MDGERLEKESDYLYEGCSPDRQVVHASDEHGGGVWFFGVVLWVVFPWWREVLF